MFLWLVSCILSLIHCLLYFVFFLSSFVFCLECRQLDAEIMMWRSPEHTSPQPAECASPPSLPSPPAPPAKRSRLSRSNKLVGKNQDHGDDTSPERPLPPGPVLHVAREGVKKALPFTSHNPDSKNVATPTSIAKGKARASVAAEHSYVTQADPPRQLRQQFMDVFLQKTEGEFFKIYFSAQFLKKQTWKTADLSLRHTDILYFD